MSCAAGTWAGWYAHPMSTLNPPADGPLPSADQTAPHRSSERSFISTDTPCVAVCSTLFDEICRGCGRTADEVANWIALSDEEKQAIWKRIEAQGYPRRRG